MPKRQRIQWRERLVSGFECIVSIWQERLGNTMCPCTINSDSQQSVGFQSLGPGSGDRKMHAPKSRNSSGLLEHLLEPCWNFTSIEGCWKLLKPRWNLSRTQNLDWTLVEVCWNSAGALLKPHWNCGSLLDPGGNPAAGTAGWNIFLRNHCMCGHRFSCYIICFA